MIVVPDDIVNICGRLSLEREEYTGGRCNGTDISTFFLPSMILYNTESRNQVDCACLILFIVPYLYTSILQV